MSASPNVAIAVSSRAENVALVREVLAGLDDALDLGGTVEDIKAAVSEAANNVVMHAYGGHEGLMEVELRVEGRELEAIVRDYGVGIGPRRIVDDENPGRCIGLAVIDALAAGCELRSHGGPGLEVAMRFDVPAQPELAGLGTELARGERDVHGEALEVAIAPPSLAGAIFNRVVTSVAARAGFSIDRLSDAQIVADALAAHVVPSLAVPYVRLALDANDGALDLRVGPLRAGGSRSTVAGSAVGDVGPVIERLADDVSIVPADEAEREVLALRLLRRQQQTRATS